MCCISPLQATSPPPHRIRSHGAGVLACRRLRIINMEGTGLGANCLAAQLMSSANNESGEETSAAHPGSFAISA